MNVARIRGFLLVHPKPSAVRVTSGEAEPQTIKPGRSYARCAESIMALGPELIECLDAQGNLLRAHRVTSADAQRSDAAAIPPGIEQDPMALMLTHCANLIHRAYEHSTEIAFTKLIELVERMGDRSDAIEQRLARAEVEYRRNVNQQISDAWEHVDEMTTKAAEGAENSGGGSLEQMLLQAFMSGKMQAQGAAAVSGKANGHGKTNGKAHGKA